MMRIRKIVINGFGKFHNRNFALERPITLFYGHNEAGKSTLMGFIRAMLFGFPTRANMKDRYEPLQGGVHGGYIIVSDEVGREYRIERYDGAAQPSGGSLPKLRMTTDDGTEVDDRLLHALLGQMNEKVYNNVFAFSLDELQHFSSLQSDEVSSYLFNAGTGVGARTLIEAEKKLTQQLEQRFKPRGRVQAINVKLDELDVSKQRLNESKVSVAQYNDRLLSLQQLEADKKQLSERLAKEKTELAWLELSLNVHEDWTLLQTYKKKRKQPLVQHTQVKFNPLFWVTIGLNAALPIVFASTGQWIIALASFVVLAAVNSWVGMDLRRQRKQVKQAADVARQEQMHVEEEIEQLDLHLQAMVGAERWAELNKLLHEVSYAELQARYVAQNERVKHAEQRWGELSIEQGRGQAELERLLSDEQYRIQRQQHEELQASFEELAGEWATHALCMQLFKRVKHTYEHEKQPAVLRKAATYFARMTDERYVRIMAPLGEKTLRVEAKDGTVTDAPFLSRGTMEQLYLAMRFAFADEYASKVALPIVMDDIFVNFDRERLRRTLALLADLSERHQVIVFTCHPHIRDELTQLQPDVQSISL